MATNDSAATPTMSTTDRGAGKPPGPNVPRSMPKRRAGSIVRPNAERPSSPFCSTRRLMATAKASDTTISCAPRIRSAGMPTTNPSAPAPSTARIGATGNGTWRPEVSPASR